MRELNSEERKINRQLAEYRKVLGSRGFRSKIRGANLELNNQVYNLQQLRREFDVIRHTMGKKDYEAVSRELEDEV